MQKSGLLYNYECRKHIPFLQTCDQIGNIQSNNSNRKLWDESLCQESVGLTKVKVKISCTIDVYENTLASHMKNLFRVTTIFLLDD